MSIEAINERLLRAIGVGVAILEPQTLSIMFCNVAFSEWFEGAERGAPITDVVGDLDIDTLRADLAESGRHAREHSARRRRRPIVVALRFTTAYEGAIVLECQNITRIRELEAMIESYSTMVERNTRDIQRGRERVERLFLNLMPRNAYEELKTFGTISPQRYDPVTVLTLDFFDFDKTAAMIEPAVLMSELNDIYGAFDRIGEQFSCERIKTSGDSYVSLCGVPTPIESHVANVVNAALRFVRYLKRRNSTHDHAWQCRVGVATGQVIGSVVGARQYVYDVFGPAASVSARLRHEAGAMEIVSTCAAAAQLADQYVFHKRQDVEIEGHGATAICRIGEALD